MLGDISPQAISQLNFLLDMANTAAKEKDPAFDVKKSFIGNLGDDLISYEKAPRGTTPADLRSPPAIFLLGSSNSSNSLQLSKAFLGFFNQQGRRADRREFLGHKIFLCRCLQLPFPGAGRGEARAPRKLHYSASGGLPSPCQPMPRWSRNICGARKTRVRPCVRPRSDWKLRKR